MEFKELIALVNAGFSKDEIKAIVTAKTKEPEPEPAEQQQPEAAPEKKDLSADQAAAAPALDLTDLKDAIADLKKTIQAANIIHNTIDTAPAATVQDAADDVIKRLINPTGK